MRASDAERQRTIDELGRHLAAGRLDADEYARRVEAAAIAVDLAELDAILADLPMLRIAAPDGSQRRRPRRQSKDTLAPWQAWLVVGVTIIVLVVAVVLVVAAQWLALGVLLGAWVLGMVQARLLGRR